MSTNIDNITTCQESYPAQAFLVCVNTGETYSLDVYHTDESPDDEYGGMRLSFGYDEISEASIHVTSYPGEQDGYAEIFRGRRIVSAHKMKSVFCDDCMYEKNGQPLEVILKQMIETKFIRPKNRPYQTNNFYEALARQRDLEMEVKRIVQNRKNGGKGKTHRQREKGRG